ncbi:MAG: SHOCT domain-containing protein [Promethearchaeota archaeon]
MSEKDYEKGIAALKMAEELDELNNEGASAKYLEAAEFLMNFAKKTKDLKLRTDILDKLDYIVRRSRKLRGIPEGYEDIGGFYKFERVVNIDPLKILKIRLAKGEISKEEYEELKRTIEE